MEADRSSSLIWTGGFTLQKQQVSQLRRLQWVFDSQVVYMVDINLSDDSGMIVSQRDCAALSTRKDKASVIAKGRGW